MAKLMIQLNSGPEDPTQVALAFLVAKTAAEEGLDTTVFMLGDAVQVVRDSVLDNLVGLGIGPLRDHFDGFVKAGGKMFASKMSSNGRGVTDDDLAGKPIEWGTPPILVQQTLAADKILTF